MGEIEGDVEQDGAMHSHAWCLCLFLSRLADNISSFEQSDFTKSWLVLGRLTALKELNLAGMF